MNINLRLLLNRCCLQLSNSSKTITNIPDEVEVKRAEPVAVENTAEPIENIEKETATQQQQDDVNLQEQEPPNDSMIKISESPIYKKYFMMLKVGIPMMAVKQKMHSEELDCDLNNPNLMINKTE
jgi:Subunit CCDC53 of WASH complex